MAVVEIWTNGQWVMSLIDTPIQDVITATPAQVAGAVYLMYREPIKDITTGKTLKVIADNGVIGLEEV